MLRKALDKFPPGTSKRWEAVQAYVRTRSVEEILDMVKHGLKAGGSGAAGVLLPRGQPWTHPVLMPAGRVRSPFWGAGVWGARRC